MKNQKIEDLGEGDHINGRKNAFNQFLAIFKIIAVYCTNLSRQRKSEKRFQQIT